MWLRTSVIIYLSSGTVDESQASACPQLRVITRTNTGINSPLDCDARRIEHSNSTPVEARYGST